jgi:hypothetical protein
LSIRSSRPTTSSTTQPLSTTTYNRTGCECARRG